MCDSHSCDVIYQIEANWAVAKAQWQDGYDMLVPSFLLSLHPVSCGLKLRAAREKIVGGGEPDN